MARPVVGSLRGPLLTFEGYYIAPGVGAQANNWVLFFQGGGILSINILLFCPFFARDCHAPHIH
jgi:hypothetical protein